MTATAVQETYLPSDRAALATVHNFFAAHNATGRSARAPRYFLAGAEPGDRVELPEPVYGVLRQVVEALQQGMAVSVVPRSMRLTTQQAADLLNVSRPTVVKLLDEGKIPFDRVGTHRRMLLADVLAYQHRRRDQQYEILESMRSDIDEDNIELTLEELRATRKAVAARRRGNAG